MQVSHEWEFADNSMERDTFCGTLLLVVSGPILHQFVVLYMQDAIVRVATACALSCPSDPRFTFSAARAAAEQRRRTPRNPLHCTRARNPPPPQLHSLVSKFDCQKSFSQQQHECDFETVGKKLVLPCCLRLQKVSLPSTTGRLAVLTELIFGTLFPGMSCRISARVKTPEKNATRVVFRSPLPTIWWH